MFLADMHSFLHKQSDLSSALQSHVALKNPGSVFQLITQRIWSCHLFLCCWTISSWIHGNIARSLAGALEKPALVLSSHCIWEREPVRLKLPSARFQSVVHNAHTDFIAIIGKQNFSMDRINANATFKVRSVVQIACQGGLHHGFPRKHTQFLDSFARLSFSQFFFYKIPWKS